MKRNSKAPAHHVGGIGRVNLSIAVIDSDRYALNAINAYLAWDRRTRVKIKADSLLDFWRSLEALPEQELPDALLLDANHMGGADGLRATIEKLRAAIPQVMVVCLAQIADLDQIYAAVDSGARAYLLKADARIHIAWALCHANALEADRFLVSAGALEASQKLLHHRLRRVEVLPGPRPYPGLTERLREAIVLYAVEGMPQRLVADEMGISPATVRGYIKRAYSILEASHANAGGYPNDMSRQEIAFMRLTALDFPDCDSGPLK